MVLKLFKLVIMGIVFIPAIVESVQYSKKIRAIRRQTEEDKEYIRQQIQN